MLVSNHQFMLCNVSEESRAPHDDLAMHALVWLCMVRLKVMQVGAAQLGASCANLRLHVFRAPNLRKKAMSYI